MSTSAEEVLKAFTKLPKEDQLAVYQAIARSNLPEQYGELTDEELIAIAAQSFSLLDDEEDRAQTR